MKITLEPTTKIVHLEPGGAAARVWEGRTDGGTRVSAVIVRIIAAAADDNTALERALLEQRPPTLELDAWPARLVL